MLSLLIILLISVPIYSNPYRNGVIRLEKNKFRIVFSDKEPEPLKIALEALKRDFSKVMGVVPAVVEISDKNNPIPEIVIVNRSSGATDIPFIKGKELDGFESHRVYADEGSNKIYLEGNDTRGTIYAIYTFSEKFLGVPPLHYWSSWVPEKKDEVIVPGGCDIFFKSPQVRYRSILPGDQDYLNPWLKLSP